MVTPSAPNMCVRVCAHARVRAWLQAHENIQAAFRRTSGVGVRGLGSGFWGKHTSRCGLSKDLSRHFHRLVRDPPRNLRVIEVKGGEIESDKHRIRRQPLRMQRDRHAPYVCSSGVRVAGCGFRVGRLRCEGVRCRGWGVWVGQERWACDRGRCVGLS